MINSIGRRRTAEILNTAARTISNGDNLGSTKSLDLIQTKRATRYVGEKQTLQDEHLRELQ